MAFGTDPEGPAFTAADGGLTVGGYGSLIFYGGARITRELSLGILAQGFFGAWSPENYGGDLLTGWLFGIGSDYTLALGANALQVGLYIGAWTLDACTGEPTDPDVVVQRGFPRPARCSRPMPSGTFTVDYVFGNGAPPDAVRQGLSIGLMGTMGISDWAETVGEPDAMGNPTLGTTTEVSAALSVFVGYELY